MKNYTITNKACLGVSKVFSFSISIGDTEYTGTYTQLLDEDFFIDSEYIEWNGQEPKDIDEKHILKLLQS